MLSKVDDMQNKLLEFSEKLNANQKDSVSGRGLLDKQHNKNIRVNAYVLLQHLRLSFPDNQDNHDMHVLTMEWSGK